jgi:hypothetical protein
VLIMCMVLTVHAAHIMRATNLSCGLAGGCWEPLSVHRMQRSTLVWPTNSHMGEAPCSALLLLSTYRPVCWSTARQLHMCHLHTCFACISAARRERRGCSGCCSCHWTQAARQQHTQVYTCTGFIT